jgi:hypothetical protein
VTNPGDFVTLRQLDRAADVEQAVYFYRLLCGQHAELVAHLKVQRDVLSRCEGADQRDSRHEPLDLPVNAAVASLEPQPHPAASFGPRGGLTQAP